MPNRIEYRGFIQTYGKPVNRLTTHVGLLPVLSTDKALRGIPVRLNALWDTGAMVTCMKPNLRDRLKLQMVRTASSTTIAGVGGMVKADFTIATIFLAPNFVLEYCRIYVLDFPCDADMIIGMDIIGLGDFAVSNAGGRASFSFAMPPFPDRIDFAAKADAANRRNKT
ncbi:MAG: retropepsin-like domain-containing protein [Spirochaetaceae bacterium]|jgi:hypothetical protein|nr:retropepsin-like domain-containing protein [Spirochaetaceae bacterium]